MVRQGGAEHGRRREPESVEQRALLHWCALHEAQVPLLAWIFAIPNGRYRPITEARKLKAEGVRRGYPDLALDVARVVDGVAYHGWRCELKAPGGRQSEHQVAWAIFHRAQGYWVGCFDNWQLAWNDLCSYLGVPHLHQHIYSGGVR